MKCFLLNTQFICTGKARVDRTGRTEVNKPICTLNFSLKQTTSPSRPCLVLQAYLCFQTYLEHDSICHVANYDFAFWGNRVEEAYYKQIG
jgi:hypothetical protein